METISSSAIESTLHETSNVICNGIVWGYTVYKLTDKTAFSSSVGIFWVPCKVYGDADAIVYISVFYAGLIKGSKP